MKQLLSIAAAAALAVSPAAGSAQAASFTLVNNTDIDFTAIKVRPFGSPEWLPLVVSPVPLPRGGGRGAVNFSNPDCAFDLQATLPDGRAVVWPRVNLCETTVVTLNRRASGDLWVDYR